MMQIRPIFAALRRHRLATLLIAMEIALACAVLCNACFLIANRLSNMNLDSGVDEASLAMVRVTGYEEDQAVDINARMMHALRAISGVQSVSAINTVPFGPHAGTAGIMLDAAGKNFGGVVDFYVAGPGSLQALGLNVVAGHAPDAEDYGSIHSFAPDDAPVLVTRALARHLWPDTNPLGKEFWCDQLHFRVVGLVEHFARPAPEARGPGTAEWSVFAPARPGAHFAGTYLVKADPKILPRVMRDARQAVRGMAPEVVYDAEDSGSIRQLRHAYFEGDRTMTGILMGVIAALLLVTALGIVGLASFWVAQRRKQIGVRRAVGACRRDILQYFQTENFLIVTFGIVLGSVLTYALNLVLMQHYELPRLPWTYLPVGALALWLVGQLAVLGPALRAANVPPVVATRSV